MFLRVMLKMVDGYLSCTVKDAEVFYGRSMHFYVDGGLLVDQDMSFEATSRAIVAPDISGMSR